MKALKCNISGTYKMGRNDQPKDYEVVGVIPFCDEGRAEQVLKNRYAVQWILSANKERPTKVRTCYLDGYEEVEHKFECIGKDIKEMSYEDIQDMATIFGLKLPLYKTGGIREQRIACIKEYLFKIKNVPIEKVEKVMELRLQEMPVLKPSITDEAKSEPKPELKDELAKYGVTIAESDSEEAKEYSLEDLKNVAKAKGIKFNPNIGYDKLAERVFDK